VARSPLGESRSASGWPGGAGSVPGMGVVGGMPLRRGIFCWWSRSSLLSTCRSVARTPTSDL